jgi:hypothetical protein
LPLLAWLRLAARADSSAECSLPRFGEINMNAGARLMPRYEVVVEGSAFGCTAGPMLGERIERTSIVAICVDRDNAGLIISLICDGRARVDRT